METISPFLDYLKNPETPFGVFDVVYLLFLMFGFIRGIFRGLPEELSQLLGTILMLYGSMKLYQPVSEFIIAHTRLEDPTASMALSYLLLLLLLMVAWKLLTFLIRKTLDWSCPKQLKRLGGAVIGTLKNAILIVVILAAVLLTGHQVLIESMVEKSWFGRQTLEWLPAGIIATENSLSEDSPSEDTSPGDAKADGPGDS